MPRLALLLFQTASTIAAPGTAPGAPSGTDPAPTLSQSAPARTSCAGPSNEIIVCGRDQKSYRLPALPPAADGPPKAEWKIFGDARMNLHGEQRTMPQNGATKPAVMATIKLPF